MTFMFVGEISSSILHLFVGKLGALFLALLFLKNVQVPVARCLSDVSLYVLKLLLMLWLSVLIFLASEGGSPSSAQGRDLESMAEARIDIKKLQHLLAGQQVNPTKALCSKFNSSAHKLQIRGVCHTCSLSRTAYLLFFCLKLFTVPENF